MTNKIDEFIDALTVSIVPYGHYNDYIAANGELIKRVFQNGSTQLYKNGRCFKAWGGDDEDIVYFDEPKLESWKKNNISRPCIREIKEDGSKRFRLDYYEVTEEEYYKVAKRDE